MRPRSMTYARSASAGATVANCSRRYSQAGWEGATVDLQLNGKRGLVTGASRGIGRAAALSLLSEGVDCAICARTEGPLVAAAEELAAQTGRKVVPIVADTADAASVRALVEEATATLGGIDVLVNNAARVSGGEPEDLAHVTDERAIRDFNEKFLGYLRCIREVVGHMREAGWGRVINVSGLAARNAGPISAGARNASVIHMTKSLARELGKDGITVNAIYPGITWTENLEARMASQASQTGRDKDELLRQAGAGNAIGRIVRAEEIGHVIAFLASPLAAGVTGEAIAVSGGAGAMVFY